MITLKQIVTRVTDKLKLEFSIDVNSKDISEGFDRPSFYVKLENISKVDYSQCFKRNMQIRIYYFPESRYEYHSDVMDKTEQIEKLFNLGFNVEERHLKIVNSIESDVIDGVLQLWFEIEYYDSYTQEPDPEEMMENLYV